MPYIILYMILEAYYDMEVAYRACAKPNPGVILPTASTAKCFVSDLSRPLFTSGFAEGSASAPPKISDENPSPHQIPLSAATSIT
jgi:hypothetical protein